MRMPRASRFSALVELAEFRFELFPLMREIPLVSDYKLFARGAILLEWLFVRVDRFEKRRDQPAHKQAGQIQPPRGNVHRYGTVRHHLRHVHLAPLPLGIRLQVVYTCDDFVDGLLLKQIFHFTSRSLTRAMTYRLDHGREICTA